AVGDRDGPGEGAELDDVGVRAVAAVGHHAAAGRGCDDDGVVAGAAQDGGARAGVVGVVVGGLEVDGHRFDGGRAGPGHQRGVRAGVAGGGGGWGGFAGGGWAGGHPRPVPSCLMWWSAWWVAVRVRLSAPPLWERLIVVARPWRLPV